MSVTPIDIPAWLAPAGWCIVAFGLALFLWAFFWDWLRRGRRRDLLRCPKCWYDMRGATELRCPECGRTFKSPRKLRCSRRRLGWSTFALLLIALGGAAHYAHLVNSNWYPHVPNWLLMIIVRDPCPPSASRWTAPGLTISERLAQELWIRDTRAELSIPQRLTLLDRQFDSDFPPLVIHTRARWPQHMPIRYSVEHASSTVGSRKFVATPNLASMPTFRCEGRKPDLEYLEYTTWPDRIYESTNFLDTLEFDDPAALAYDVTITADDGLRWTRHITAPITRVATIDDAIHPVRDESVTVALRRLFQEHLALSADGRWISIAIDPSPELLDLTIAASYELRDGDYVLSRGVSVWRIPTTPRAPRATSLTALFPPPLGTNVVSILLQPVQTPPPAPADLQSPTHTLRITGDPELALTDFDSDRYWSGTLDIPCAQLTSLAKN